MADRAANIAFSRFRGERLELGDGIVLVNDCYNANPVSMRAALDHLAVARGERGASRCSARWRELGPDAAGLPPRGRRPRPRRGRRPADRGRRAGPRLRPRRVVGDPAEAAELLAAQLEPGDAVLVKGSRSVGLETVAETAARSCS